VNEDIDGAPESVNSDPYGGGWMIKVRLADPSQLDSDEREEYESFVANEAEGDRALSSDKL